jgi:hypothetical protein
MSGSWNPLEFPRLTNADYKETSRATKKYNCIAWAAKDTTKWWWPDFMGIGKWPDNVPRAVTVDAFVCAFGTLGYQKCPDGSLEAGFEKVAIYAKLEAGGSLQPTHMAIQLSDGHWSSKIGPFEDISHPELETLFGPSYGNTVACYLKKPLPQAA